MENNFGFSSTDEKNFSSTDFYFGIQFYRQYFTLVVISDFSWSSSGWLRHKKKEKAFSHWIEKPMLENRN